MDSNKGLMAKELFKESNTKKTSMKRKTNIKYHLSPGKFTQCGERRRMLHLKGDIQDQPRRMSIMKRRKMGQSYAMSVKSQAISSQNVLILRNPKGT